MAQSKKKTTKRPGPRPQGPYVDKRKTLTTRITEETRTRLEKAAAATDRSLSQEIEFRLERSFLDEDARNREMGGKELQALFRLLGAAAEMIEARTGKKWSEDWDTGTAVMIAWQRLIAETMPKIPNDITEDLQEIGKMMEYRLARDARLEGEEPPNLRTRVLPETYEGFKQSAGNPEALSSMLKMLTMMEKNYAADESKSPEWRAEVKENIRLIKKEQRAQLKLAERAAAVEKAAQDAVLNLFPERKQKAQG